jgi:hypothetical protein
MKQKTAVEWLYDQLMTTDVKDHVELLIKAKEMEKEQIMDAFNDGVNDECIGGSKTPEQYYNETFKSE